MFRKQQDVPDIRDNPAGKKARVRIPDPVRYPRPLKQIDQRQHTLIVPVEHRRLKGGVLCCFQQIAVLRAAARQRHFPDGRASAGLVRRRRFRPHLLWVPQPVPGNKMLCRLYDDRIRPVIVLHQKDAGPRVIALKIKQSLRVCRPESVDTLILIADHEKLSGL